MEGEGSYLIHQQRVGRCTRGRWADYDDDAAPVMLVLPMHERLKGAFIITNLKKDQPFCFV